MRVVLEAGSVCCSKLHVQALKRLRAEGWQGARGRGAGRRELYVPKLRGGRRAQARGRPVGCRAAASGSGLDPSPRVAVYQPDGLGRDTRFLCLSFLLCKTAVKTH